MSSSETGPSDGPVSAVAVRWTVLGVLVCVLVGALGWSTYLVLDRGAGSNPISKFGSLIDPDPDPAQHQEKAVAAARTFVQRFNTYGPDLLDDGDKMPDYAAVGDLMTSKFAEVFAGNVCLAEKTVAETGIDRAATVLAVGITSIDDDSAEALAAGIVRSSYPDPDKDGERIDFAPQRFRYEVSLVRHDGRWQADDLDDVDDDLPSLAQGNADTDAVCGGGGPSGSEPEQDPTGEPGDGASDPGDGASEEGGQQ